MLMLLALLPMLTFMGHWPRITVDLPGDSEFVLSPGSQHGSESIAHTHTGDGASEDDGHHGEHCHSGVATCTDIPFTGGVTVLNLQEAVLSIGLSAAAFRASDLAGAALTSAAIDPDLQPPRDS